jgi:O-antigen/teichoic acid export membrane protein
VTVQNEPELFAVLERSTRTGIHVIGLRLVTYATAFVGGVLVARSLGPDDRGRYILPLTVLAIVFTVTNLGLEQAQVNLAARGTPLRTMWANATIVGAVVSVVVWVSAAVVVALRPSILHTPASWIVLTFVQLPLLLHILYWLNILQLAGRVRAGVAASALASGAEALAVLALYAAHALTPFRALAIVGAGNLITWGVLLAMGRQAGIVGFKIDAPSLRRGLRFGVRAQFGVVFTFLLLRVDQIMVQNRMGFAALGTYSLAVVLAELMWLTSEPFASALLPHQVEAEGDDDIRLGLATARVSLLLVAVAGVIAWLAAPWAIRTIFGSAYDGAIWPFRWLLPGVVALTVQRPLAGVLLKRGRPALVSVLGGLALALNVAWNLTLIPRYGLVAASIGSSVAYTFLGVAYLVLMRRMGNDVPLRMVPGRAEWSMLGRIARAPVRGHSS